MREARRLEEEARALDAADPLAPLRDRFVIPPGPDGQEAVYLCGNSLGLLPRAARDEVRGVLEDWGRLAVRGHHEALIPWYAYHEALAPQAATLVGAREGEVVTMNSLTVNLHLMMVSFFRPEGRRRRIAVEAGAFPSDRYAVESQLRFHGLDPALDMLVLAPRPGETLLRDDDVEAALTRWGDEIALLLLGGVQYLTGQWFDLARATAAAHRAGAVVGLDLAHAAGNVPLALHDWGPDFAVWCGYKYLNGGPGAPGGCFVHERHKLAPALPRLAGWWGTDPDTRFQMGEFHLQSGAPGWQLSNPPILSMAALKASLDLFHETGMPALREKSERLTGFQVRALEALAPGAQVLTPPEPERRGCQLSLQVAGGAGALVRELGRRGIVCDAREPDVLRAAPAPLYNRFHDAWAFARALGELLAGT